MQNRETSIDLLKIAAMLMVVFYHTSYYNLDYGYTEGASDYVPNLARALMNLCSMGVPLFFMCSGYCTLASSSSGWKKMGRKVITILLLSLLWNYLTLFPVWFFKTLAVLYLITPALRLAKERFPRLYWCGIVCTGLASFGMNEAYALSRMFTPNVLDGCRITGVFTTYALVYYALGDWLRGRKISPLAATAALAGGFILSLADCSLLTNARGSMFDGVNASFPMLSALLMTFGTFSLVRRLPNQNGGGVAHALAVISSGCLAVFIFHGYLLTNFKRPVCDLLHIEATQYNLFQALVLTIIFWVLSWCIGMTIRQIPYARVLMKL